MTCYIYTVAILAIRSDRLLQIRIRYFLKSFKIATMAAILDTGTEQFSTSESPCHPVPSHLVSAQPDLLFGKGCGLKNF